MLLCLSMLPGAPSHSIQGHLNLRLAARDCIVTWCVSRLQQAVLWAVLAYSSDQCRWHLNGTAACMRSTPATREDFDTAQPKALQALQGSAVLRDWEPLPESVARAHGLMGWAQVRRLCHVTPNAISPPMQLEGRAQHAHCDKSR